MVYWLNRSRSSCSFVVRFVDATVLDGRWLAHPTCKVDRNVQPLPLCRYQPGFSEEVNFWRSISTVEEVKPYLFDRVFFM